MTDIHIAPGTDRGEPWYWLNRLNRSQKLDEGGPYLYDEPKPTPGQVAAVLHALADHTLLEHMLAVAGELGKDRESLGWQFQYATGIGRFLQSLGDAAPLRENVGTDG